MSNVDTSIPVHGNPTTQSVRDNFSTIKTELEAFNASSGSSLVGFIQSGTGPEATTVEIKNRGVLDTFDFYTDAQKTSLRAGSSVDITTRFALAVAEAQSSGRSLKINASAGHQVLASSITFTQAVNLFGEGFYSSLKVDSAVGAAVDILKIVPAAAARLFRWSDFRISPVSGTPGRHAIHIDLTAVGVFVANAIIEHLWLSALGGKGINLTNPTNVDGFFTSSIQNCIVENGIYLQRSGDSVNITENVITGANAGIDLSMVSGAAQTVIEKNNITSAGGAIVLHSGNQVRIRNNQIEQSVAYTGSGNACIWVRGDTSEVIATDIGSNNINGSGNVGFGVYVENALNTFIGEKNTIACTSGTSHIGVDASAVETIIGDSNDFFVDGLVAAAKITDAGVQTYGPPVTVSSFSNGWVSYDTVNFPVRYSRNESGDVVVSGAVKDGTTTTATTIFTLPAGFRPATGIYFSVTNNNAGAWGNANVLVTPAGAVQIISGTATLLSFGGITFKAAL